uniref:Methyltransf_11 domain-containing protein n=1 Tax=Panagrellus redivivus TaxID=6233 RepID=A0A7E4V904_PANRE
MNLIPKDPHEFSSGAYWRKFFEQVNCPFEWYGNATEYQRLFIALKPDSKILQVGCGNSKLENDMYAKGYTNIHSIDINEQVIAEKKKAALPGLTYAVADITNFDCEDNIFDGIVDKGTFDALCPTDDAKFYPTVDAMFRNCMRVLKPNGKYFIITLGQDQNLLSLEAIFHHRRDFGFIVHRVDIPDKNNVNGTLPAVLFEITKLNKAFPPEIPISLYYINSPGDKPVRMDTEKIAYELNRRRHMCMFFSMCKKPLKAPAMIDINDDDNRLRWRFWVVDGPYDTIYTLAFIVISPEAKILPDFYNVCPDTFQTFRKQVNSDRVVLAEQQQGVNYGNHDAISRELEEISANFMTKDCSPGSSVSYISTDTGEKSVLYVGKSEEVGDFEVHNAFLDKTTTLRRLIFKNTPTVIQSDCLVKQKDENDENYSIVDTLNINSDYQAAMAAGLAFRYGSIEALVSKELDITIIGIGGGTLPTFLHTVFKKFKLTCIELIPEFFEMAAKYFDYPYKDERVKSIVMDGLEWLKDDTNPKVDVLCIDVGTDSASVSYPPPEFNTTQVLCKYKERIHERGLLIVNIFISDEVKFYELLSKFQAVFDYIVIGEFGSNHILVASQYTFTPRKQYPSRVLGGLPPEHRILAGKICEFVPLHIPKKYRIPKIHSVEKQKEKKEKAKERQKKSNSREKEQRKKEAIKRQVSKDDCEGAPQDELADAVAAGCNISGSSKGSGAPKISYAAMASKSLTHTTPTALPKTETPDVPQAPVAKPDDAQVQTKPDPVKKHH